MEMPLRRTWAEIDLDALAHNLNIIRRQVGPEPRLLGVVKADAYGHGAVRIAKKLEQLGAGYLAVSNIEEAEELRRGGVTLPILMLGYTPADQAERILRLDMTQCVPDLGIARAYDEAAAKEIAGMIGRFLETLDRQSRIMFVRRYWHADSIEDLSALFHKSRHYVSVRLSRIRKASIVSPW